MSTLNEGKATKRKYEVAEFKADNIDNTAPVKKILDDIQHKNVQAYKFYCYNIKQRFTTKNFLRNFHYTLPGHPLYAFDDDWDGQLRSGYFEAFTYKSLMPKIITPMRNIHKLQDPVTELIKLKSEWQCQFRNYKSSAVCGNMMEKYEKLNEDVVWCPKHLVDMAAHLDSDPDPHFDSSYNWYYAGHGNLQLVCVDWIDYLLYSEFNYLYLSHFYKDDITINFDHTATFDCGEGVLILETICSPQNVVVLRTKNKIFLLKIVTHNDDVGMEQIKVIESELPYTSVSFDNHHKNILYVTTVDSKFTIVNLDRMKGRSVNPKCKGSTLVDNWNTVTSSERTCYTHVTPSSINIYDKRTNDVTHTWKNVRHITDDYSCNDISAVKQPEGRDSMYFTTDHHLFLMDLRKVKVVQRWTHGMQCVPCYMSISNFEFNKELICLSSQWCEDMCVVVNWSQTFGEKELSSVTLPYRPPSILDALNEARQNKLCHDLFNPIDNRLTTSITGSLVLERGDKYAILTQNSLGDITSHILYPEHLDAFMENDSIQHLGEWSKSYKMKQKEFEVSSVKDIAKIWEKLKRVPESYMRRKREQWTKFNEKEIFDAFENEEVESGLLDLWVTKPNDTTAEQTSTTLNLHYSDSE